VDGRQPGRLLTVQLGASGQALPGTAEQGEGGDGEAGEHFGGHGAHVREAQQRFKAGTVQHPGLGLYLACNQGEAAANE